MTSRLPPDNEALTPVKQCGRCKHYHPNPTDPNDLRNRSGQCRAMPPQVMTIPLGPGQAQVQAVYPTVAPTLEACGLFAADEVAQVGTPL